MEQNSSHGRYYIAYIPHYCQVVYFPPKVYSIAQHAPPIMKPVYPQYSTYSDMLLLCHRQWLMYSQCFHNYSSLLPYIHAGIVNPSKYNSKMALFFLSLCIAILVSLCTSGVEGSHSCPYTWSRPAYHSSDNCTCGDSVRGRVECNENNREVKILLAYCMTYDNTSNETLFWKLSFFPHCQHY